jgi:sigma-E factor negative regulatory protein RseC
MGQLIEHSGIIDKIENNRIQILINPQNACSECLANGVCNPGDNGKKIIEFENFDSIFKKGDKVIVSGQKSIALQSVLIAFVIPFFLIFIILLILKSIHVPEIISGILSIGVLLPYYSILSFFNTKLKSIFKIDILKDNGDFNESTTLTF